MSSRPEITTASYILTRNGLISIFKLKQYETTDGVKVIKIITKTYTKPSAELKLQLLPGKQAHQSQVTEQEVLKSSKDLGFLMYFSSLMHTHTNF